MTLGKFSELWKLLQMQLAEEIEICDQFQTNTNTNYYCATRTIVS